MLKYFSFLLFFSILLFLNSCRKESLFEGTNPMVQTSTDTLTFDTVFTTIGSATRSFKVYNREDAEITVDIALAKGSNSMFRLNADGFTGTVLEGIRINANDSIYVFADVTVDPDQPLSVSPFIIEEELVISSGETSKTVLFDAWGQNANYVPGRKSKGIFSRLSCDLGTETWDDPKPYVIYGILIIDSCELVLPAGTDIYVHGGVVTGEFTYSDGLLLVEQAGKITARGTALDPVTFQGDRLEFDFENTAGQWVGIRVLAGSKDNSFTHTNIKNSVVGVRVDSVSTAVFESCEIKNTTASGLIGFNAEIEVNNTAIYNNGASCVQLIYGGDYAINHSTLASFGNQTSALTFTNWYCEPSNCEEPAGQFQALLKLRVRNSIIFGNEEDELLPSDWFEGETPELFDYQFENCIVRVDEILDPEAFPLFFDNCLNCNNADLSDTLFVDDNENLFQLDTASIAIDQGVVLPGFEFDIYDNPRDNMPDLGAYEFQQ